MSDHDIRALDANFGAWKTERAPDISEDKAFEVYALQKLPLVDTSSSALVLVFVDLSG